MLNAVNFPLSVSMVYVTITATPTDSEKNDCPIAYKITSDVTCEKSGCKKKRTPSPAPSNVSARTINTKNKTNSAGMKYLFTFSTPFCTPLLTIKIVIRMNNSCDPTAKYGLEMISPNVASYAPFPSHSLPVIAFHKYNKIQPPTTL